MIFEITLNSQFCSKAETKNFLSMISVLVSRKTWETCVQAEIIHRCSSLKCNSFTNSGKPAAVFGYLPVIKVVEVILTKSTAAGLPGGLGCEVGKMIVIGWNDDELIHGSLDKWGNGGMGEWSNKCMVAWLLRSFLIVNCQLLIVNCEFKTRRNRHERSW